MSYDPSKTTAENLADLKAQNDAADRRYDTERAAAEAALHQAVKSKDDAQFATAFQKLAQMDHLDDIIPADTDADVMGYFDLNTEDWEATPEKVRDILRTLFAFE